MNERETILLVEDDDAMRESCAQALAEAGFRVLEASGPKEAEPQLLREVIDLVVTDLRMPEGGGQRVMSMARDASPDIPVILITAYPSVESAIDAFKKGVVDYLPKPFSGDQLLEAVHGALRACRVQDRTELLRRMGPADADTPEIIGSSEPMRRLLSEVRRVAALEGHVLVSGETGSGKELVARAIHRLSPRASAPFVAINCAAMPEALLEAEIFGHEKGAFTGAVTSRPGLLEQASPGTLCLDEVGDLPATAQAKLLRALEEKSCRRVGALRPRTIDVRIVSVTNKDLREEVRAGRFREDMFYRLAALEIRIPSLRERPEDIPRLATHFLDCFQPEKGPTIVGFSDEALHLLQQHTWPGNVRELQNAVQKILARAKAPLVGPDDVRTVLAVPAPGIVAQSVRRHAITEFERGYLADALRRHDGNVTHAARSLGIHRTTLQRLMKKHGLATNPGRKPGI